jgi:predicted dehydrogenase
MTSDRRFGVGIVGAGMAARPHVLALRDLADTIEVRGVHTRDAGKRAAFCGEHGVPPVASLEALLADPGLDAVVLLTPPNARMQIVEAAAAAGKHLLMEKPVERTTDAARKIVEVCEAAGVKLGIVFQHRFREASLALRELLATGRLGRIATVHLVVPWWRPQSYYDVPGRGTLERDGGGVLISQAIHPLDLMLSFTGPVEEVQAVAGTSRLHRMEAEDFVGAGLRFADGALGALMASTASFPGGAEYMELTCENGSARLSGNRLTVRWIDGRTDTRGMEASTGGGADPMDFPHGWHAAQLADFVAAVREDREPVSNGRTALRVHRLIDALLASARTRTAATVVRD